MGIHSLMNGVTTEWSSVRKMTRVYKQLAGVGVETIANQPRYKVKELFGRPGFIRVYTLQCTFNFCCIEELVVVDEPQQ